MKDEPQGISSFEKSGRPCPVDSIRLSDGGFVNIISALMEKDCIRVSYGDKWLIYDNGEWVVCQRKYGAKKTVVRMRTKNQDEAINILCNDSI